MAEVQLPGEVDQEVIHFSDGPARKDYLIVKDVPVLDEHMMTGDHENPEEWIGPDRLKEIAANNNNRVNGTGDATPIIIGHTKDGLDERKQPPVVGYATNFVVHRLLNTQKDAIHADFHILKDKIEEVKNYPRRSVELWPKRWEIDPIALLGATTPERDLGLLQLSRYKASGQEKPRRYSRVFNEDSVMAKPKKMDAGADGDEGEMEGAGGSGSKLSPEDIQAIVAALLESAPMKELLAAGAQSAGGEEPPPEGGPMDAPGGDSGVGPGGAMDAPGGDPGVDGGPTGEAAFFHQPHMNPEAQRGMPRQYEEYDDDGGDGDCAHNYDASYGSATDGYMPGTGGYGAPHHMGMASHGSHSSEFMHNGHAESGYVPTAGNGFYEEGPMGHVPGANRAPRGYQKTPAQIRYERYMIETGQMAPLPPPPPMQAVGQERPDVRRLQQHDANVRGRRQQTETERLKAEVVKLQRKNTESERTSVLMGLQAEGFEVDVAEEIGDVVDMKPEQFTKYVQKIRKYHRQDPASVQMIRPADEGKVGPVRMQRGGPPATASENQAAAKEAQAIGGYMHKHGCDYATAQQAIASGKR